MYQFLVFVTFLLSLCFGEEVNVQRASEIVIALQTSLTCPSGSVLHLNRCCARLTDNCVVSVAGCRCCPFGTQHVGTGCCPSGTLPDFNNCCVNPGVTSCEVVSSTTCLCRGIGISFPPSSSGSVSSCEKEYRWNISYIFVMFLFMIICY